MLGLCLSKEGQQLSDSTEGDDTEGEQSNDEHKEEREQEEASKKKKPYHHGHPQQRDASKERRCVGATLPSQEGDQASSSRHARSGSKEMVEEDPKTSDRASKKDRNIKGGDEQQRRSSKPR